MKKLGLGISILLFAIVFQFCSSGLEATVFVIGLVGLGFAIAGFMDKSN